MAESKDQRRARLNREGKEFLKTGQEHLITDQHRTAMDYMARKRAADNARRNTEKSVGDGGSSVRAKGTGVVKDEKAKAAIQAFDYDPQKRDKAYEKISKKLPDVVDVLPRKAVFLTQTRSIRKGAINADNSHHTAIATVADHLSDLLEKAEDSGSLHSKDTTSIDSALEQAYRSITASNGFHDMGQVNDAKVHMESAATNLLSAATQLSSKGVNVHPEIPKLINNIHQGYVRSSVPGEGAMPHVGFQPPKEKSKSVVSGPKRLDASKISDEALQAGEDVSWAHEPTDEFGGRPETHALMSRQIRDALGY